MVELVTLVEQHIQREPTTTAIQATTEWEAVLVHVYLQEDGLGVHLPVKVCCHCMHVHSDGGGGAWWQTFFLSIDLCRLQGYFIVCLNIQRMRLP